MRTISIGGRELTIYEESDGPALSPPERVFDGRVWEGVGQTNDIGWITEWGYIIPIKGGQWWHAAIKDQASYDLIYTKRAIQQPDVAGFFRRHGFQTAKASWFPSRAFPPVPASEGANPAATQDPRHSPHLRSSRKRRHSAAAVYFLLAVNSGLVKIGWAGDPRQRASELQTGCPFDLILEATIPAKSRTDEGAMHKRFKKYRHRGEWFKRTGELAEFIDSLKGKAPNEQS